MKMRVTPLRLLDSIISITKIKIIFKAGGRSSRISPLQTDEQLHIIKHCKNLTMHHWSTFIAAVWKPLKAGTAGTSHLIEPQELAGIFNLLFIELEPAGTYLFRAGIRYNFALLELALCAIITTRAEFLFYILAIVPNAAQYTLCKATFSAMIPNS